MGITDTVKKQESKEGKEVAAPEKRFHQFFAARPRITIVMPDSTRIHFVGGRYLTDKQNEIEFLTNEVKRGHDIISIREGEETLADTALDPLAALREKFFAEFQLAQKAAIDPKNDFGKSEKGANTAAMGAMTSRGIADMAAQVTSVAVGAGLK